MIYIANQSLKMGILKTKKLSVIVFFMLISALGYAQQVSPNNNKTALSGKITDSKTNEPLYGVSIFIQELQTGATTDEKGRYIMKVPSGEYSIILSYVGYSKITEKIVLKGNSVVKNFKMEQNAIELGEAVITAKKGNGAIIKEIEESPMAVSVIDGKELRGVTSDINDVLTRTSGITIRKTGGMGSESRISVHGLEGKRVAVFLNGFALSSPDGSFDINDIPIDIIERIEVYKGIVPAEFGGDGLGGAINIETREVHCDLLAATLEAGSYGTYKALLTAKKVFDKPGIQLSLSGLYNQADNNYTMNLQDFDPDSPYSKVKRNNDFYFSGMASAGVKFMKLWFDEIALEANFYENKREIQNIYFDSRFAYNYGTNIMPMLKLEKEDFFLPGLDFKLMGMSSIANTHLVDTVPYIYQWNGERTNRMGETSDNLKNLSDDKQFDLRGKLNLKYTVNDNHRFNLNNQFGYANRRPKDDYMINYLGYDPSGFPSKMKSNVTGLAYEFFSTNKRFQNIASIKAYYLNTLIYRTEEAGVADSGFKQEPAHTSSNQLYWGWLDGVSYELWKGFRVKAAYEHAVRLPDTKELFGDGTTVKSSVNLRPEQSDNFSTGIILDRKQFLGLERVQLEANVFYMLSKDLISLMPADMRTAYQNIDNTTIKGFDADLKVDIIPELYGYFNLTYQDLRNSKKWELDDHKTPNPKYGKQVPNIPSFYYNAGLEFHREDFLLKGELFRLFVNYSYVGKFNYAWAMSDRKEQEYRWTIPACHNLSAGIQQSFLKNQLSFCFEMDNILDAKQYNNYKMPLPGRTFNIKLRYNWFKDKSEGGAMAL